MSEADANANDGYVEELLNEFCALGRNGVAAWRPSVSGIELIIAPKFLILQNAHKNDRIVVSPRRIDGPDFQTLWRFSTPGRSSWVSETSPNCPATIRCSAVSRS